LETAYHLWHSMGRMMKLKPNNSLVSNNVNVSFVVEACTHFNGVA